MHTHVKIYKLNGHRDPRHCVSHDKPVGNEPHCPLAGTQN